MTSRKRTLHTGFTLVEMLIALMVTAMLAMLVFAAFRIATGSWDRVVAQQDHAHESYLVQTFVRRLLEQAQSIRIRDIDAKLSVAMRGDDSQLTFITELPTRDGIAQLYWCQLHVVETDSQDKQLVMTTRPYTEGEVIDWQSPFEPTGKSTNSQEVPATSPENRVLLDGVAELHFEYLYYDDNNRPAWRRNWGDDESILPVLIRMQALPLDSNGQTGEATTAFWPDLLVSPTMYRYVSKTLL